MVRGDQPWGTKSAGAPEFGRKSKIQGGCEIFSLTVLVVNVSQNV